MKVIKCQDLKKNLSFCQASVIIKFSSESGLGKATLSISMQYRYWLVINQYQLMNNKFIIFWIKRIESGRVTGLLESKPSVVVVRRTNKEVTTSVHVYISSLKY